MGESKQSSSTSKFMGEFYSIWANFVQCRAKNLLIWGKLAQIGKLSPKNFWGEIQLRGFAHFEQVSPKKKLLLRSQRSKKEAILKISNFRIARVLVNNMSPTSTSEFVTKNWYDTLKLQNLKF
jgi:hypothetical protein